MLYLLGKNPPIQQVIDCGVVPFLIRFLQMDDNADLQLEAAGAIANIAFSNRSYYRKHVIEVGVVPILIRLLSSMNEDVRLQAAWGLGNLASENYDKDVKYRDILLAEGALPALIQTTENRISEQIIYAIGNLCDGKPFPDFEVIRPALPLLSRRSAGAVPAARRWRDGARRRWTRPARPPAPASAHSGEHFPHRAPGGRRSLVFGRKHRLARRCSGRCGDRRSWGIGKEISRSRCSSARNRGVRKGC